VASRISGRIALFHGRAAEKPALRRSFEGWMTKTRPKVYLVFLEAASPQMWSPPRCGLPNAPRMPVPWQLAQPLRPVERYRRAV
jgi:hypothetical protein